MVYPQTKVPHFLKFLSKNLIGLGNAVDPKREQILASFFRALARHRRNPKRLT